MKKHIKRYNKNITKYIQELFTGIVNNEKKELESKVAICLFTTLTGEGYSSASIEYYISYMFSDGTGCGCGSGYQNLSHRYVYGGRNFEVLGIFTIKEE